MKHITSLISSESRHYWRCSLCDHYNSYTKEEEPRYENSDKKPPPEIRDNIIEYEVTSYDLSEESTSEIDDVELVKAAPVMIAVVDLSGE